MSNAFDPYYTWLGIPKREQPPTHYRLLGIDDYESTAEVIDNAADRVTTFLRSKSTGKNANASQQLLNEVASAARCLLDDQSRQAYDALLRSPRKESHERQLAPPPPGEQLAEPPLPLADAPQLAQTIADTQPQATSVPMSKPKNADLAVVPTMGSHSSPNVIIASPVYKPDSGHVDAGKHSRSSLGNKAPRVNSRLLTIMGIGGAAVVAIVVLLAGIAVRRAMQGSEIAKTISEPPSVISQLSPIRTSVGIELKLLPAGQFTMGSESGGRGETPHQVTLTQPFYLGVHEVTQEQYERVMGENPSVYKGAKNPVEGVSWEDAVEFCRKLSELPKEKAAGHVYRLPTEAEWEYACRAGTTTKYSFGDEESQLGAYAWYDVNSDDRAHPVGQKRPNPWGLYDMHGNVWEWCQDSYGAFPQGLATDPKGPSSGSSRVNRGGCWLSYAGFCRSALRDGDSPTDRFFYLGFRVACVPSSQ